MSEHRVTSLIDVPNEDGDARIRDIQTADGMECIAHVYGSNPQELRLNARRLAAAWNALVDIPTEVLEAVGRHETPEMRLCALARVPGGSSRSERSRT